MNREKLSNTLSNIIFVITQITDSGIIAIPMFILAMITPFIFHNEMWLLYSLIIGIGTQIALSVLFCILDVLEDRVNGLR